MIWSVAARRVVSMAVCGTRIKDGGAHPRPDRRGRRPGWLEPTSSREVKRQREQLPAIEIDDQVSLKPIHVNDTVIWCRFHLFSLNRSACANNMQQDSKTKQESRLPAVLQRRVLERSSAQVRPISSQGPVSKRLEAYNSDRHG